MSVVFLTIMIFVGRAAEAEKIVRDAAAYNGIEMAPFKLKCKF